MRFEAEGVSDTGTQREKNEDRFLIDKQLGLYVVCDGMGGHAAGEVAAQTALTTLQKYLMTNTASRSVMHTEIASIVEQISAAVQYACKEVFDLAAKHPEYSGMGTTLSMLFTLGDKAIVAHVGDSRVYLRRGSETHLLTRDHALVAELLDRGAITPAQAEQNPYRHVLTRALGQQESVAVDTLVIDVLPGDIFVLCSDGLSKSVGNTEELQHLLGTGDAKNLAQYLVDLSLDRDGSDNTTALVVRVPAEAIKEEMQRKRAEEVNLKILTLQGLQLFRKLDLRELTKVMEGVAVVDCPSGHVLMREGEAGDRLYVILSGDLKVSRAGKTIASLSRGAHVGEMALLNAGLRSATVQATSPCRLLVMARSHFDHLVNEQPRIGVKLLAAMAHILCQRLGSSPAVENDHSSN